MGKLIRSMDWTGTPLGPIESWPQSLRIVVRIKAEEVLIRFADFIGVRRSELSVCTGITEVEGELSCLHLNRHGIGGRCCRRTMCSRSWILPSTIQTCAL